MVRGIHDRPWSAMLTDHISLDRRYPEAKAHGRHGDSPPPGSTASSPAEPGYRNVAVGVTGTARSCRRRIAFYE